MAEEFQLHSTRQRFSGAFSLGKYYDFLYDLFRRVGFVVCEDKYRVKNVPGAAELEIMWSCTKDPDSYSRIKIAAKTLLVAWDKKEVMIEGIPTIMDKGDLELELRVTIVTDYNNRWETNPFLQSVKPIYDKYIYRNNFRELEKIAINYLYFVENQGKEFFKMETF